MKIGRDKILHFETCALATVFVGIFLPWWGAVSVALVAGIGKELWDKYHNGVPSWYDVLFDVLGILLGLLMLILKHII